MTDDAAPDRHAARVAGGSPRAGRCREGAHAAGRRARRPAPGAALGTDREGIRLRDGQREEDPARALRRPLPAARLPLHVRVRVQGRSAEPGMHRLLLRRRSLRRRGSPSQRPRRDPGGGVDRRARGAAPVQGAHGLDVSLGLIPRQRFQVRLRCRLHGGAAAERCRVQLPPRRPGRAPARGDERLRAQGRCRAPHLLHLRPWSRAADGDLPDAGPGAARSERGRTRVLVAPPRRIRDRREKAAG